MKLQLHKLKRNTFSITQQLNSLKVVLDNNAIKEALEKIMETEKNLKELLNSERDDTSVMCSCDDSISTRKYLKMALFLGKWFAPTGMIILLTLMPLYSSRKRLNCSYISS